MSEVDWKIAPSFTNSRRIVSPLVRLPLWAIANPPNAKSANSGCTFLYSVPPVVEYLTCPIAELPFSLPKTLVFVKVSLTNPIRRSA